MARLGYYPAGPVASTGAELPVEIRYQQALPMRQLNGIRGFVTERGCRLGIAVNNDEQERQYDDRLVGYRSPFCRAADYSCFPPTGRRSSDSSPRHRYATRATWSSSNAPTATVPRPADAACRYKFWSAWPTLPLENAFGAAPRRAVSFGQTSGTRYWSGRVMPTA